MERLEDLQEPDEARPAKRVRLEGSLDITEDIQDEIVDDSDWDDVYGLQADTAEDVQGADVVDEASEAQTQFEQLYEEPILAKGAFEPSDGVVVEAEEAKLSQTARERWEDTAQVQNSLPVNATGAGIEIVAQQPLTTTDERAAQVLEETTQIETEQPAIGESITNEPTIENNEGAEADQASVDGGIEVASEVAYQAQDDGVGSGVSQSVENGGLDAPGLEDVDAEFLQSAEAQKDNKEAEWQFDSSDAASSDSDSDSSSDDNSDEDDSGSEDGYEMLDPAAAAKLLMQGDGDDEDGAKGRDKPGVDRQPRTTNETKEEIVPKPDVVVTEDMKITYLGTVDRVVDSQLLIKAVTPGEYQVLEYGSVLCTENREVIGAVADTIGRVQEPIYSVAFTNAKEIEDAGYAYGTKIFYVDSHSSFVFTQPLKNLKGTDASNLHDEEVGEDEIEFSDDEKEAEYKRMNKASKRGGRGALSKSAFMHEQAARGANARPMNGSGGHSFMSGSDRPQQQYGGGMSYDDADVQDEFYSPLRRPDNLSQMMATGGPPRPQQGRFDGGRGRGGGDRGRGDRGRGRGDRGRGRGGFDRRDKPRDYGRERGGAVQQNGHRGNAHSFPDRHNDGRSKSPPQWAQYKNHNRPQASVQPQRHNTSPQQYQNNRSTSPQQTYQFNGYTFQYGNPPPQVAQQPTYQPQQQYSPIQTPTGAYVNPAFFQNQQQWSPPPPQQQQPYQQPNLGAWQQQMQQNVQAHYSAPGYDTPHVPQQHSQPDLADILRQLGGAQR